MLRDRFRSLAALGDKGETFFVHSSETPLKLLLEPLSATGGDVGDLADKI